MVLFSCANVSTQVVADENTAKTKVTVMKEEPKICKYLDIPLQHIADPILKSIKRGTTQAKTTQLLKDFREAMLTPFLAFFLLMASSKSYPSTPMTTLENIWMKRR